MVEPIEEILIKIKKAELSQPSLFYKFLKISDFNSEKDTSW